MKYPVVSMALAAMVVIAGCSKKQNGPDVSKTTITSIASGAKTKSGKTIDVYELKLTEQPAIVIVLGGGKLETNNPAPISLNGQPLVIPVAMLDNKVVIINGFMPVVMDGVTVADARTKCAAGGIIDLPMETAMKNAGPTGMPSSPNNR